MIEHVCDGLEGKQVVLTVGLPRSGKTTWARSTVWPIVNPDSIRLAIHGQRFVALAEPFVWATAFTMAEALLRAGHDTVVVDATNITKARRKTWVDRFKDRCAVGYHVVTTPAEECIRRARSLGDEGIIPVIQRMAAECEMPDGKHEGFDFVL